jgi:phage-related minor tail protein
MAEGKVLKTVVKLAGAIDPSLAKSINESSKNFKHLDASIKIVNKSLLALSAASATAVGYLVKSGNDYIRTMNDISAQTGLAGAELEELENTAREVYKSGMGENFQEVADALINVKQASGLAGEELEKAASSGLMLKDTFDFEINESTRAASALMKNFSISAEEAYGIIATGAQNGANKNGDLLDTLNEYSVHYKALGLDADQFVTSLIAGAEAGSFSIDKVGDAVKEFTIRSKDGSKKSVEAFEALGLNAKTMTAAFSMGGAEAEAAFFKTVQALDAMEDPMAKNAAGVALFGTMFEDLESGVLKTLGSMNGASVDAIGTLEQIERIKYNDAGYALSQIGRSFTDALIPASEKFGQALFDVMPDIKAGFEQLTPVIIALGEGFVSVLPVFISFVQQLIPFITQFAEQLQPIINEVFPILLDVLMAIMPIFFQLVQTILPPLLDIIKALAPVIGFLAQMISVVLGQAINIIMPIINSLVGIFTNLVEFITNVFSLQWGKAWGNVVGMFKNLFGGIVNYAFYPLNILIGLINTVISGLNMLTLPDWVPGIGGKGINIPLIPMITLPKFATGGFTDGLSIAGEAGTEAVISFDRAYRNKNIGIWEKAGQMLGVSSSSSGIEIGGLTINFDVHGGQNPNEIVSAIKDNIHDVVDELVDEMQRRTFGSYNVNVYTG